MCGPNTTVTLPSATSRFSSFFSTSSFPSSANIIIHFSLFFFTEFVATMDVDVVASVVCTGCIISPSLPLLSSLRTVHFIFKRLNIICKTNVRARKRELVNCHPSENRQFFVVVSPAFTFPYTISLLVHACSVQLRVCHCEPSHRQKSRSAPVFKYTSWPVNEIGGGR